MIRLTVTCQRFFFGLPVTIISQTAILSGSLIIIDYQFVTLQLLVYLICRSRVINNIVLYDETMVFRMLRASVTHSHRQKRPIHSALGSILIICPFTGDVKPMLQIFSRFYQQQKQDAPSTFRQADRPHQQETFNNNKVQNVD